MSVFPTVNSPELLWAKEQKNHWVTHSFKCVIWLKDIMFKIYLIYKIYHWACVKENTKISLQTQNGPFCAFFGPKTVFLPSKGPFGSKKAHIGIQKVPIHCWVIRIDKSTPILPSVVTKRTRAHLFWPKNSYLISCWASKGPFESWKANIGMQNDALHCWVSSTDRLTPIWPSVVT